MSNKYEVSYGVENDGVDYPGSKYEFCPGSAYEVWRLDGVVHREHGPAITVTDEGELVQTEYWLHGRRHRKDGPAVEHWSGEWYTQEFFRDGLEHRDDGPAYITRSTETGLIIAECYHVNGQPHRDGGKPASLFRDDDTGVVWAENYYVAGVAHRTDGPSKIERSHQSGIVTFEEWRQRGALFRADGKPPRIWRHPETGETTGFGFKDGPEIPEFTPNA